jgi:hypothetical protein
MLRDAAYNTALLESKDEPRRKSDCDSFLALADALDAAPAVSYTPLLGALTWNQRVETVQLIVSGAPSPRNAQITEKFSNALRAAFPELAPADDR